MEKYQWYRVRGWSNTKILGSVHVRRHVYYQKKMAILVKQKYITEKNGNFWYSTDTLPRKNGNFGTAADKYLWYRVRHWSNTKILGSVHVRRLVHYQKKMVTLVKQKYITKNNGNFW